MSIDEKCVCVCVCVRERERERVKCIMLIIHTDLLFGKQCIKEIRSINLQLCIIMIIKYQEDCSLDNK